jgi:hypothetical protein
MKPTVLGLFMSMAMAVCIQGQTQIAHISSDLHSEFVVRFALLQNMQNPDLPSGSTIVSEHESMKILVVKNERMNDELFTSLLQNMNGAERVEKASKDKAGNPVYATGFVLVSPSAGEENNARNFCKDMGCETLRKMRSLGWIAIKLPGNLSYEEFRKEGMVSTYFDEIMKDEIILASHDATNDPLYIGSWHIQQGNDKDIDADEAWNSMPANAEVKNVAVIDGHGFDTNHPDMVGNWADTYNAVNQTTNVLPTSTYEKHATSCAGIPGAVTNNALGVPGLGNNLLKVQAVQIGYNPQVNGTFYTSSIIQADAINHVIANTNTVAISMSFGSTSYQAAFYNAITSARTTGRNGKGIVVFASTGNNGTATWTNYPASYAGVVAVGSSSFSDLRSSFSNYGTGLTFCAPGSGVQTIDVSGANGYSTSDYTLFSGTSAACPVAASVGGMMLIANPSLTETQAKQLLAQSCEKVGGYTYAANAAQSLSTWSNELGYGRINMNTAIQLATQITTTPPDISIANALVDDATAQVGQVITITANQLINMPTASAVNAVLEYRWSTDQVWAATDPLIGTNTSALGNGIGSEAESITYTVPSGSGTRYVLIKCDATNLLLEANETNNIVVIPITVSTVAVLPDVTITSFTVNDNTPDVGQQVNLSCVQVISNSLFSTQDIILEYRYSTDAIWSTTDILIGSDTSTIGITPVSSVEDISYIIPAGSGIRYVLVRADILNTVAESNESNNISVLPITVSAIVAPPDVTLNGVTATSTNVLVGESVTVSCSQAIANPPATTVSISLEYRWSADLVWSTTDLLLGTGVSTLGGAATSESESLTFLVPDGVGTYYLLMKADATNSVAEVNESNIYNLAFNVSVPSTLPDIFVDEFISSAATTTPGTVLSITCFQNISIATGPGVNVFMEYRWATTTNFSPAFPIVGVDFSSLGAGDFDDPEDMTFTVPAGVGQRYLMIRCDSNNGVAESNETNNVVVIPIMVVAPTIVQNAGTGDDSEEILSESMGQIDNVIEENFASTDSPTLEFSFYPNPVRQQLNITLPAITEKAGTCQIRNLNGEIVRSLQIPPQSKQLQLDMMDLRSGTYLIEVSIDGRTQVDKIVVAN